MASSSVGCRVWVPQTQSSHPHVLLAQGPGPGCSIVLRVPSTQTSLWWGGKGTRLCATSPPKPPSANSKAAAFTFATPALAEKLLSRAIRSHPANFSKHLPIKLYKYIHLVNIPLTRSAYSIHNLLESSTKSVTEAIMQLWSRQLTLILIWGWGCTCQCSFP